jgi:hypothetical protein
VHHRCYILVKRVARSSSIRPPPSSAVIWKRLLAPLPPEDFEHLLRELKTVPTKVIQIVHTHGEPVGDECFPNGFNVISWENPDGKTSKATSRQGGHDASRIGFSDAEPVIRGGDRLRDRPVERSNFTVSEAAGTPMTRMTG